ncbi:hypothetical protein PDO_4959 [Rhizobium sp. PDO1-076]|uniref:hypothetical protein n=1 Tax=Rhizobium sp. PDO1-076 TaxID=1125979 RepID=UPI00024E3E53|nr:hypothetical protein [Rhizobium sp. PDO1-076]EHS51961.1 hypothetical protein PDO_4959 [Rhizobium sp. PDO1-076]
MISEFIASLFAAFVVEPVQADILARLDQAGASVEVLSQSRDCLATTAPILISRAGDDIWWAGSTVVAVATGWQSPAELLDAGNPACGPLATFLTGTEASS